MVAQSVRPCCRGHHNNAIEQCCERCGHHILMSHKVPLKFESSVSATAPRAVYMALGTVCRTHIPPRQTHHQPCFALSLPGWNVNSNNASCIVTLSTISSKRFLEGNAVLELKGLPHPWSKLLEVLH